MKNRYHNSRVPAPGRLYLSRAWDSLFAKAAYAWDPISRKPVTENQLLPSYKAAPVRKGGSAGTSSREERKMI